MNVVSLFSGAGGLDLGFVQAGHLEGSWADAGWRKGRDSAYSVRKAGGVVAAGEVVVRGGDSAVHRHTAVCQR